MAIFFSIATVEPATLEAGKSGNDLTVGAIMPFLSTLMGYLRRCPFMSCV